MPRPLGQYCSALQFASFLFITVATIHCSASADGEAEADANADPKPRPTARLRATPAEYAWDKVFRGEQISHIFVLKNTGKTPLVIKGIKPSCGCTVVRAVKPGQTLDPGATLKLPVDLDTGAFVGDIAKRTEIFYDDEPEPLTLLMRGRVESLLEFDPKDLAVEIVCGGSTPPKSVQFRMSPVSGSRLVVKSTRPKRDLVKVAHKQIDEKAILLTLTPIARPGDAPGPENEALITDLEVDGERRILHLPVTVLRRARIQFAARRSVFFRRQVGKAIARGEGPVKRQIDVQSGGGPEHRFRIVAVKNPKKFFVVKTEEVVPGRHYRISVSMHRVPNDSETKFLRDVIELKTDDPLVPVLKIPVRAQF